MSHPDGLPDLSLDRSLGRIKVPRLLRDAGLRLVTLAEQYGVPADGTITDADWLQLAGPRDWAVFMKDTRIRYNLAERKAVTARAMQGFCLSTQSLSTDDMVARFLENLDAITAACAEPGPFIYAVRTARIERLKIGEG